MLKNNEIKVVLLGDSGVGKSSILLRYAADEYNAEQEPTLGAAFLTKMLYYNDSSYKLQIWDTAGQEKFKSLAPIYYRDAIVILIVFDITSQASYEMMKSWLTEVKEQGQRNAIIIILANKSDLIDQQQVNIEDAQTFCNENNLPLKLTSAKLNQGITDVFIAIAKKLEELFAQTRQQEEEKIRIQNNKKKKQKENGSCC